MNFFMVTVVISTYGRSHFLENAINSVLAQTYKNIEIIVVDDNAELPIVRNQVLEIVRKFPEVKLIQNKKNLGGALSRNEGIKAAKGELISFLDDDDSYFPDRIQKCVDLYEKNLDASFIYTYCQAVSVDGRVLCKFERKPEPNPLLQHLLCGCLCATSQWVVPKKTFEKVGLFEDTPCKQDSIMLLKILGYEKKILCVEEVLSNYTVHEQGRISGNYQRNIVGLNNYRNFFLTLSNLFTEEEHLQISCVFARDLIYCYLAVNNRRKAVLEIKNIHSRRKKITLWLKCFIPICMGGRYIVMVNFFCQIRKKIKKMIRK